MMKKKLKPKISSIQSQTTYIKYLRMDGFIEETIAQ